MLTKRLLTLLEKNAFSCLLGYYVKVALAVVVNHTGS